MSTANIAETQIIPAIIRAENAEVIAIASSNERAQGIARKFDIDKVYESYDGLLKDPNIDAVYIPLPNHLHKEWTIAAAEHRKHVLSEKPAALNTEDTIEMTNACKQNNVKFMEAFMYQFHPQHNRAKEIIASGEIGEVKLFKASFSFFMNEPEGNIRMDASKGGGSIYDIGSYCIHSMRNVIGSEPRDVAVRAIINPTYQIDHSAFVQVQLENGVQGVFDCSFGMSFRHEYEVVGTKGVVKVPRAFRPDLNAGEGLVIIQNENERREEIVQGDQYKLEIEDFSQVILENKEPMYTIENTINNMRAIDLCYKGITVKSS